MRHGPILLALLLLLAAAGAQAQTADQARLMFSLGIGQTSGGGTLWSVRDQPFLVSATQTDSLALTRSFRRNLDVVLSGTYFPGNHLGFNAEAQLLGLGTEDNCRVTSALVAGFTDSLCRSISHSERSATSATLSVGAVYRFASRQVIHPYVRTNAGLLITQQSFLKTKGTVIASTGEPTDVTVYEDRKASNLEPYLSFGGGVVAVIGRGYQFRFEVRDNWVRVPAVDGTTSRQGVEPPHRTVGKHLLTFTVGFDVVLERKRGRRY
jgi:hypothetical protein